MQRASGKIRLVIFDWAGTILDFGSCAPVAAFVEVFGQRGVEVSLAEARAPMGMHKRDHLVAMLEQPTIRSRWRGRFGRDWSSADVETMYHELIPLQLASLEKHEELIPELLPCVEELRRRQVRIGGTTGYFQEAAQRCLQAARRQGFEPDANVCGDEVPEGRPAPWMIYRVMEQLQIYPVEAVVKVGDTRMDVEEGRNAGCWSIGVTSSSSEMGLSRKEYLGLSTEERARRLGELGKRFEEWGAHGVLETLQDLPPLLDRIEERMQRGERP